MAVSFAAMSIDRSTPVRIVPPSMRLKIEVTPGDEGVVVAAAEGHVRAVYHGGAIHVEAPAAELPYAKQVPSYKVGGKIITPPADPQVLVAYVPMGVKVEVLPGATKVEVAKELMGYVQLL